MFYSQFILAKKGPLGTIWIAAHLERKLRKNQVADTDIGVSVDSILFPEMPIALRLSSHLLLGVVRIYSKKVNYLFDDCSEALLKVKQAFRSTAVDLPPEESTAPYHSITMPETFDLDDFELPDNDLQGNYVDQHISAKEQITLQDTMEGVVYSTSRFGLDERFGDGDASGLDLDEDLLDAKAATPDLATGTSYSDNDPQASVHASASGILNEEQEIDDYDGDNEPVDYEGPCTPGLGEEPNLSNIQETSACDDHQEPENHTITEFAVKENLENASHQHHHNQFESHEKSLPHVAATENMLMTDLGSTPFTDSRVAETVIHVSNDPAQVENLPNKYASDVPPGFQIADLNHATFVQFQGNQITGVPTANDNHENSVEYQGNQDNAFHRTTELKSNTEKYNVVSNPQHHASLEPKDSTMPVLFPHASMPNSDFPVLRPCVTFPNHETNGPHATEPMNKNFPEIHHAEISQSYKVRVDNAIQTDIQVENINRYTNDFPAPVIQREAQVENINRYANDFPAPVIQREVQVQNINRYANDFPAPLIRREVQVDNINRYANDFSAPAIQREVQVENVNRYANDFSAPAIQREVHVENINRYANDFSAPAIQREVQVENINRYTNDFLAPAVQREVQVENINRYTNDYPAPAVQREVQVENVNNCTNDFSAPEKRLSLPHWLSDVPKSFVPESTPIEKDITSGKKRTFTESSMTPHSLNLNESSGLYTTTTNMTSQSFSLNQSSGFFTTNTPAQSLNLNESSGFYTTNTTAQSLNLNESSGFYMTNTIAQSPNLNQSSGPFTINITEQSVMNDDELLSSILVGRKSSILKMRPTAPVATPSTKRRRTAAPKTSAIKRKVLMDDNMVLHGDTIRAQLTNTEDIRRLRKKAPCTRSEISMLEKQFWEDEIFSEPVFSGVSIKLASLHKQLYNLSKIVVSHYDTPLEGVKDPESISQNVEKDTQLEVEPIVPKEIADVGPVAQQMEFPMVRDSHTHDNNPVDLDHYGSQPPQIVATEHVAEPFNSEHDLFGERNAMEIDPKSFQDADIGAPIMPTEVEPPAHASVVPTDTFDTSAATVEVQIDASLQTDVPGVSSSDKIDIQSFDLDVNGNKSVDSVVVSEIEIDAAPVRDFAEEKQDQDIEFRKNEEVVNEDAALASNVESNVQNSVYNGIFGEEFETVGAYDTEVNPVKENVSSDEREIPGHQVTFETTEMNAEDISASNRVDDDEHTHPAVENNTDFLNFDDDDDGNADAGGDYGPDVEATRVIDNSGWSTRTKAVAKYLKIMFDKEGERGRNMIAVNNLLVGKTRKEASRMFFETLVLKTKDYIHVEQPDPFSNIHVFPRAKLLKSDF